MKLWCSKRMRLIEPAERFQTTAICFMTPGCNSGRSEA